MWIFKAVGFISITAMFFYSLGVVFGAVSHKKTVSVYDLKQAMSVLVDDVTKLKIQLRVITADILDLKRQVKLLGEVSNKKQPYEYLKDAVVVRDRVRVRLSPWGHILGLVPKGTEVVLMKRKDDWCLTNLGYIHCSLLEVK